MKQFSIVACPSLHKRGRHPPRRGKIGPDVTALWPMDCAMRRTNHRPVPDKVRDWLSQAVRTGASDLHLIPGYPPVLRLHGDLIELSEPPLEGEAVQALLSALCPAEAFT